LGSSPTNEKTIVIDDGSSRTPEDEAQVMAKRMAQRADTLPPQRPRLEIEIPPELQRRSGKTGLWIAGALSLLIGVGAVFALSGGADVPPLAAEKSAEVKAVMPEPTPAAQKPAAAEPGAGETEAPSDVAASDVPTDAAAEGSTPSEASEPVASAPVAAKPNAGSTPVSKPATTAAKKPTTTTKPTAPPPSKTAKVKKPTKPTSKTIVRDAPF
jgi:hypothetical protein